MLKFLMGVAVGGALAVTMPFAYELFVNMVNAAAQTEFVQQLLN